MMLFLTPNDITVSAVSMHPSYPPCLKEIHPTPNCPSLEISQTVLDEDALAVR